MPERTTEPTTAEEREWWKRGFEGGATPDLTDRLIDDVNALITERNTTLRVLHEAENAMDMLNGDWGKADRPCCFCRTRDYNGQVGIIHDDACPIAQARTLLVQHDAKKETK